MGHIDTSCRELQVHVWSLICTTINISVLIQKIMCVLKAQGHFHIHHSVEIEVGTAIFAGYFGVKRRCHGDFFLDLIVAET